MCADFIDEFVNDPQYMLGEESAWQVTAGEFFSIDNMDDDQLSEAIVDDVLGVTMFERQTGKKLEFDVSTLQRFLKTKEQINRVNAVLVNNAQMMYFIDAQTLRIRNNIQILQEAMDYCGVYYNGYTMPDDVITINRDAVNSSISNDPDFLNNLATEVSMSLASPHQAGNA